MCSDSYSIPILSLFFLYHPYIPHFLIQRNFHFLVLIVILYILLYLCLKSIYSTAYDNHYINCSVFITLLYMYLYNYGLAALSLPILSLFFLYHPYIPHFLIQRFFSFSSLLPFFTACMHNDTVTRCPIVVVVW